eukprot:GHVP01060825.1.p2 GENE.GHVP01060825.1~~GHVP01060825.1.p2  ORF type:complete len:152 (+),score=32.91 GHVP01060825.1:2329-2784(+)
MLSGKVTAEISLELSATDESMLMTIKRDLDNVVPFWWKFNLVKESAETSSRRLKNELLVPAFQTIGSLSGSCLLKICPLDESQKHDILFTSVRKEQQWTESTANLFGKFSPLANFPKNVSEEEPVAPEKEPTKESTAEIIFSKRKKQLRLV